MKVIQMQHDSNYGPVAAKDYSVLLGTPFAVLLFNGVEEHINAKGKRIVDFADLPGLIASIVQGRVLHPQKLTGEDLKYIRSALRMRSMDVAEALELSSEHYSRCENGTKRMSDEKEKFYRMYAFLASVFKDRTVSNRVSKDELFKLSMTCSSPEKAEKAMAAFGKIFFDMKIRTLHAVGSEVELQFSRRLAACKCGDGENWRQNEAA